MSFSLVAEIITITDRQCSRNLTYTDRSKLYNYLDHLYTGGIEMRLLLLLLLLLQLSKHIKNSQVYAMSKHAALPVP